MWLEIDEQSTGGRRLSDVRRRTNKHEEVRYVILSQTKRYNRGKCVSHRKYKEKLTVQLRAAQ